MSDEIRMAVKASLEVNGVKQVVRESADMMESRIKAALTEFTEITGIIVTGISFCCTTAQDADREIKQVVYYQVQADLRV